MKKHIITIAGRPGSGKSTTSKAIAEQLGYEHFSSGDLFRAIGRERGFDVHDTNVLAEKEKEIDELVDQRLRDIGASQDNVAIDSRMAWHWMQNSFKVFLDLDLTIAAERILSNMTAERIASEHIPSDPKKYAERLASRLASETKRYKSLYNVDPYDKNNYDLVVDTSVMNAEEVIGYVLSEYQKWLEA